MTASFDNYAHLLAQLPWPHERPRERGGWVKLHNRVRARADRLAVMESGLVELAKYHGDVWARIGRKTRKEVEAIVRAARTAQELAKPDAVAVPTVADCSLWVKDGQLMVTLRAGSADEQVVQLTP